MLNSVFGEILGDEGLFTENLSNVVDSGKIITTDYKVMGDDFDNYAGKIVDKVGRTIFWDRVYTAEDLGLWRDSFEYGSVLEKIRCEIGEYSDNCEWKLNDASGNGVPDYNDAIQSHIEELFKFYPATVQAKYFNAKTTFKATISITRKQLRGAFNSAADLARFIGMIEQRIRTKMEISKNQLQKMVIANLMGEHIAQAKQVINLATDYVPADGETAPTTLADALANPRAVRYIAQKMTFYREMMAEPSKLYSATGNFYNHTPVEDSRMIVLADLDSALRFNVYGDTYNEEFVKLNNYKTVPFWQTSGTTIGAGSLADRSGINVVTSNGNAVSRNDIIGVLFDRDAAMICNEEPDVRTQYNPDGNFTNFFYCADCSYYNDFDENAIVFTWGDGSVITNGLTAGKGNSSGKTVITAVSPVAGTGETFQYKVADEPVEATIGAAVPTGFSSLTVGAAGTGTDITATEGQYVTVVRVKSSKVTGYGTVQITKADIK